MDLVEVLVLGVSRQHTSERERLAYVLHYFMSLALSYVHWSASILIRVGYTVVRVCASPRDLTWFTRPLFLIN